MASTKSISGNVCSIIGLFFLFTLISILKIPIAHATVDDDIKLRFKWLAAKGSVAKYKVRVYESLDGGKSYKYKLSETTLSNNYELQMNTKHNSWYKIDVAAIDSSGKYGPWSEMSDPVLCYLASQPVIIKLKGKWNFISLPVQPNNTDLKSVLSSIEGKYKSVWFYDTRANLFKLYSTIPGHPNSLTRMEAGKGYLIQTTGPVELRISNWRLLSSQEVPIQLWKGLGFIGYNSLQPQPIDRALSSVRGKYKSMHKFDSINEKWILSNPPGYAGTTDYMKPGDAYMIETAVDKCVWDINMYDKPALSPDSQEQLNTQALPEMILPYNIWGEIEADGIVMKEDDDCDVILKSGDRVLATSKIEKNEYGNFYSLDIPVGTDNASELDIYIRYGKSMLRAAPIPIGRSGEIRRVNLSAQTMPKNSLLHQNYPNPFNPDTWIPYQLKEDGNVVIKIYTSSGQLIRTLDLGRRSSGYYTDKDKAAHWDGMNESGEYAASGVYFYTIKAGDFTSTRKMVVAR